MDTQVKRIKPGSTRTDCLVVAVFDQRRLSPAAKILDKAAGGLLSRLLRREDFSAKLGESLLLHEVAGIKADRLLLIGCGAKKSFGESHFRKLATQTFEAVGQTGAEDATLCLLELAVAERGVYWKARQLTEAAHESVYRFDKLKEPASRKPKILGKLTLVLPETETLASATKGVADAEGISAGVAKARDLGNLPANICTPSYLATQARHIARAYSSVKVHVMAQTEMQRRGMGSLLAVARGSREPAKLITLEYKGKRAASRPVALVGKGVTFDSGGISIKPAAAMDEMKFDMCGAASVLGTIKAIARLRLPINVVGVVPATENLPDGNAVKPGDVVKSMSGQTVEILNTDAEGRLILCDALTYVERYKPEIVVDIATLTGACVVALGSHAAGLFSNDEPLVAGILDAGEYSGDRAWRMPLWDEYQEQLKSNFADMANVGGREAGAITAACFLSRYANGFRWAHLDIAGVAWNGGAKKGATGRPVKLLTQLLMDWARKRERL